MRPGTRVPSGALHAPGAGQHGLARRDKSRDCYLVYASVPTEERRAPSSFGNCALKMLAEGFQPTRLETRTKESNMYASWWVENPRSASNLTGGMACACTIDRP